MARYIDADKFMERLKASSAFSNMGMDGYFLLDVVEELLKKFPAADVVPKSEVEKIFEEVKALLEKNKCRTYYINGIEVSEHFSTNLEKDLAELKKKYTEGEG